MDLAQFPLRYKLFTKQLLDKSPTETWLKLYSANVSIHISEVCGVLAICFINLNRIWNPYTKDLIFLCHRFYESVP